MLFKRKLHFILFGNKEVGKTTLAKVLCNINGEIIPTKEIAKLSGISKLESSKRSSFFSLERYRKYKLTIVDVPGSFEDRREWREAFKKIKRPYALCLVIDPFQAIPESQSVLEDVYNRYLESLSKDIEKADLIAKELPLLLLIIINHFSNKGEINEDEFYEKVLKKTIAIIKSKLPLVQVDVIKVDLENRSQYRYELDSILEKIKRFYWPVNY